MAQFIQNRKKSITCRSDNAAGHSERRVAGRDAAVSQRKNDNADKRAHHSKAFHDRHSLSQNQA